MKKFIAFVVVLVVAMMVSLFVVHARRMEQLTRENAALRLQNRASVGARRSEPVVSLLLSHRRDTARRCWQTTVLCASEYEAVPASPYQERCAPVQRGANGQEVLKYGLPTEGVLQYRLLMPGVEPMDIFIPLRGGESELELPLCGEEDEHPAPPPRPTGSGNTPNHWQTSAGSTVASL